MLRVKNTLDESYLFTRYDSLIQIKFMCIFSNYFNQLRMNLINHDG